MTTLRRFYRRAQVDELQAELEEEPALTPPQTEDLERAAISADDQLRL